MKKQISVLFGVIFLCSLFNACDIVVTNDENEPEQIDLKKGIAKIIEADQKFAFDLFQQVCSLSEEDNIMISPLSVSYALGMTFNGAVGETDSAFRDVLYFDDMTNLEVNESYKELMGQLTTLDDKVELAIANGIWHVDWAIVKDEFVSLNREYFDAAVSPLDFSDPASVDVINDWIEEKTNDKIQDMLDDIPDNAYMYLVNAIYFNAQWKYEFDEEKSYSGTFILEDGSDYQTELMAVSGGFNYAHTENFQAVEMPYGDSAYSMIAILPAEDKSISDFIAEFDNEMWQDWYTNSGYQEVHITLPKFKYEFKDLLNEPLKNLGLGIAFDGAADFSKITEQVALYISRVIHQTFIDVNEKGSEAAAATIVEMVWESVSGSYFNAARPFLYLIKENSTGAIIFMGKVGKPEYEAS